MAQIYLQKEIYDAIVRKGEDPSEVVNKTMRKLFLPEEKKEND